MLPHEAKSHHGDLRPLNADLLLHALNVYLGCVRRDAKLLGDLAIRAPLHEEEEDLEFARPEIEGLPDDPHEALKGPRLVLFDEQGQAAQESAQRAVYGPQEGAAGAGRVAAYITLADMLDR